MGWSSNIGGSSIAEGRGEGLSETIVKTFFLFCRRDHGSNCSHKLFHDVTHGQ